MVVKLDGTYVKLAFAQFASKRLRLERSSSIMELYLLTNVVTLLVGTGYARSHGHGLKAEWRVTVDHRRPGFAGFSNG